MEDETSEEGPEEITVMGDAWRDDKGAIHAERWGLLLAIAWTGSLAVEKIDDQLRTEVMHCQSTTCSCIGIHVGELSTEMSIPNDDLPDECDDLQDIGMNLFNTVLKHMPYASGQRHRSPSLSRATTRTSNFDLKSTAHG